MTKISLTDDLKLQALQQYHPYISIDLWSLAEEEGESLQDYTNVKIIENDIEEMLNAADRFEYQKYVSKPSDVGYNQGNFDNIIFTPDEDLNTIIPYEYYMGVFYLRLPYFCETISLHILTKYFNAMDSILLLKTEDIINSVEQDKTHTWSHSENVSRSEDKIDIISSDSSSNYGRYLIPLPQNLQALNSIEIDYFLTYTNTHDTSQVGIIDTNSRNYTQAQNVEKYHDQSTLISNSHNSSIQAIIAQPISDNIYQDSSYSYSNVQNANNINLKTVNQDIQLEGIVKYINDDIYIEQYNTRTSANVDRQEELKTNNQYNYTFVKWPTDDE